MGVPVVDDEDSEDSDASGHLVIETMGLQGQKARNSGEEFDQDYMPSSHPYVPATYTGFTRFDFYSCHIV